VKGNRFETITNLMKLNSTLDAMVVKPQPRKFNQRDFFPRTWEYLSGCAFRWVSIFPADLMCPGLNFRTGSMVLGRAFGANTMGQPS
jgi:hypothetical protein